MSEARKLALLQKIIQIASNDVTASGGIDREIKLIPDEENKTIVIDLLVNWMRSDEEEPDKMSIHYAASKSVIKLPHPEHEAKMHQLLERHVNSTIKKLRMPNDKSELAQIEQELINQGELQLQTIMAEFVE